MRPLKSIVISAILLIGLSLSVRAQDMSIILRDQLRSSASGLLAGQEKLHRTDLVSAFYMANQYEPVWNDGNDISILQAVLQFAGDEGLEPSDYHLQALRSYQQLSNRTDQENAHVELLLTDAFMHYGSHLLSGKVDPVKLYADQWEPNRRQADFVVLLQKAIREKSVAASLKGLRPRQPGYSKLRNALQYWKNIARGSVWPEIPQGISLKEGMRDDRIVLIRKQLLLLGEHDSKEFSDSTVYDSMLVLTIRKFQQQHGLEADGVIGKRTVMVLNATPEEHIQKIMINMERYRWLPDLPGSRYVWINIPSFQMDVIDADTVVLTMKAIVGRTDRKTPVFRSDIHYLIVNPTWTVPPTILREDVLPAVKRNIAYLKKNELKVINNKGQEVDPVNLPWASYTAGNFPYQLRQESGPKNALGLIKFQFPNNHKVFLHDTNSHGLFSVNNRALSSGCIRIEYPFTLASYLLRDTSWTKEKLEEIIKSGKTQTIVLPADVPIYINYFTAFVDEHHVLQSRNDLYNWDKVLQPYFPL
jgi:L,D-transpeptidase YcbB